MLFEEEELAACVNMICFALLLFSLIIVLVDRSIDNTKRKSNRHLLGATVTIRRKVDILRGRRKKNDTIRQAVQMRYATIFF
jgi:hypothetical protein